jgi:hypothetical protein
LLDIFAKHQASSPLILDIAVSLFTLITQSGEPEVTPKATRVLRAIVARSPRSGLDREDAIAALEKVHQAARRDASTDNAASCEQFSLFLLQALLPDSAKEVVSVYSATLEDLLTVSGSRVPLSLVTSFFKRYPLEAWSLRERLLASLSPESDVRAFRRMQVMTVLNVLLTSLAASVSGFQHGDCFTDFLNTFLQKSSQAKGMAVELGKAVADTFFPMLSTSTKEGETGLNAAGLRELFKLALQAARLYRQLANDATGLQEIWKPSELESLLEGVRNSEQFKASSGVHSLGRQLLSVVRSDSKTGEKRKADGKANGIAEESVSVKKRRSSKG